MCHAMFWGVRGTNSLYQLCHNSLVFDPPPSQRLLERNRWPSAEGEKEGPGRRKLDKGRVRALRLLVKVVPRQLYRTRILPPFSVEGFESRIWGFEFRV